MNITHRRIRYPDKMVNLVSSISEKIERITIFKETETEIHLRRNNRIRSIHSSLKIEANSLSISEVRDLINGQIVLGDRKEIQEVKNTYLAYEKIPELDPYSVTDLKSIHGIMTFATVEESGRFRRGNEGVFSGDRCIFIAPPPELVLKLIEDLFLWMKDNSEKVHPLILASIFRYEFVFIHPFSDANGRMARLWHTALLSKWKKAFEFIPLESQIEEYQEQYYQTIEKCHTNGNSNVFIEFMLEMIDQVLEEITVQKQQNYSSLSKYTKRLLNCMEYGIPYTAKEIMEN